MSDWRSRQPAARITIPYDAGDPIARAEADVTVRVGRLDPDMDLAQAIHDVAADLMEALHARGHDGWDADIIEARDEAVASLPAEVL